VSEFRRDITVRICLGCFDGNIHFPLLSTDQGIDFFPDQSITMQVHECTGEKNRFSLNVWKAVVLKIDEDMFDKLLEDPAIQLGPSAIHPDWRHHEE
jgi:hypothetical protein